jgi:hypothetical protein
MTKPKIITNTQTGTNNKPTEQKKGRYLCKVEKLNGKREFLSGIKDFKYKIIHQ